MGSLTAVQVVEAPVGSPLYLEALALREAILRRPLGLRVSAEELQDDRLRTHFCAVEQGKVVGCVSLRPLEDGGLQLKQMAVAEERRLEGLGALLMANAEDWALAHGFLEMMLHARIGADGFYRRLGYAAEGPIFDENTIPHIKMKKALA
jgi:predicted GNAT family N-acyltransferase